MCEPAQRDAETRAAAEPQARADRPSRLDRRDLHRHLRRPGRHPLQRAPPARPPRPSPAPGLEARPARPSSIGSSRSGWIPGRGPAALAALRGTLPPRAHVEPGRGPRRPRVRDTPERGRGVADEGLRARRRRGLAGPGHRGPGSQPEREDDAGGGARQGRGRVLLGRVRGARLQGPRASLSEAVVDPGAGRLRRARPQAERRGAGRRLRSSARWKVGLVVLATHRAGQHVAPGAAEPGAGRAGDARAHRPRAASTRGLAGGPRARGRARVRPAGRAGRGRGDRAVSSSSGSQTTGRRRPRPGRPGRRCRRLPAGDSSRRRQPSRRRCSTLWASGSPSPGVARRELEASLLPGEEGVGGVDTRKGADAGGDDLSAAEAHRRRGGVLVLGQGGEETAQPSLRAHLEQRRGSEHLDPSPRRRPPSPPSSRRPGPGR